MLPEATRRIIGRRQELAQLTRLLDAPGTRIATVVGIGGVGKTTICLEAARSVAAGFADGATFVSFEAAAAPEIVTDRIARTLGIEPGAETITEDEVLEHLADRELLLFIDNFEVVESSRALLARIRDACPGVVLLISSRRRTQVSDEYILVIEPMAIPQADESPTLDAAMSLDVVQLFADRARLARSNFDVTAENLPALLSICRHLEGIPLAIELAAARIGAVGLAEMASGFESRLDLAADGPPDVVNRLRSVAAAIAWGYELLEPDVQHVFRVMSVFTGGFTLAAAKSVTIGMRSATAGRSDGWWLNTLQSLVDAQLIQLADERRYRMLSTIREYGLRQLNSSGERQTAEQERYAWCLKLARMSDSALRGDMPMELLVEVESDLDNVRAALRWSISQASHGAGGEMSVELGSAMWPFWSYRGYWVEATDWLQQAVSAAGDVISIPIAVACLYIGHGHPGRAEDSIVWYKRSLEEFRLLGDDQGIAVAIGSLSSAYINAEQYETAIALGKEAFDRLVALDGDRRESIVTARIILADALLFAGLMNDARRELETAIALAGEIGNDRTARVAISALARLNRIVGRQAEAISALESVIDSSRESGDRNAEFRDLVDLGLARIEAKDLDGAGLALNRALGIMLDLGYHERALTRAIDGSARLAALRGNQVEAARLMGAASVLRANNRQPLHPLEQRQLDRERAWLRQRLGPSRFETELLIGQGLSRVRSNALALQMTSVSVTTGSALAPMDVNRGLLSPREFEVLTALVEGKSDKAIGEALGIKPTTARTLVQRVREKLGADNRHEAVAIAVSQGLVRSPVMDLG